MNAEDTQRLRHIRKVDMLNHTMPRVLVPEMKTFSLIAVALLPLIMPCWAQQPKTPEEIQRFIEESDKRLDGMFLKGLLDLRIGLVGSAGGSQEDETRKLVYDTLRRYRVPVEWIPTTAGIRVDVPTIFVRVDRNVTRSSLSGQIISSTAVVHFEIHEKVRLVRNPAVEHPVAMWTIDEQIELPDNVPVANREIAATVKRLTEQFCLRYLAANR